MSYLTNLSALFETATQLPRDRALIEWSGNYDRNYDRDRAIIARMFPHGAPPRDQELGIADVADDLGVTDTTILKWIKAKKFPAGRGPRSQRFWLESDIAAWLDAADCRSIN